MPLGRCGQRALGVLRWEGMNFNLGKASFGGDGFKIEV